MYTEVEHTQIGILCLGWSWRKFSVSEICERVIVITS
jgi:hypothetical protein